MSDAIRDATREEAWSGTEPVVPQSMAPIWFFGHLVAMLVLHFALPLLQWNLGASRWWGLPFAMVGFALVVIGARRFHPITTLRPYEEPSVLITDGLHRYSRNPMYVGLFLSLVGCFIMLGSLSPLLALPSFYWLLRYRFIAYEEHAMEARFGDAYRQYKQRVRRWL